MEFSSHSINRQQQRGMPDIIVDMILKFGTRSRKPGNVFEYKITRKDKEKALKNLKSQIQALEKVKNKDVLLQSITLEIRH